MPTRCAHAAELPGNVPADCNPLIRRAVEYWVSIHPDDGLPGRQHFDPVDVPELLANLRLMDVEGDPPRFRIRVMGTRLVEYFGSDHTGRWYNELFANFDQSATHVGFIDTIRTKQPDWRRGNPALNYEKKFMTLERVFLPFARDGKTVDMLMTIMLFGDSDGRFY